MYSGRYATVGVLHFFKGGGVDRLASYSLVDEGGYVMYVLTWACFWSCQGCSHKHM